MKAVLISIRPEWVKKILDGEKTVEVRKTAPKLPPPFKCYIYCTLSGSNELFREILSGDVAEWNRGKWADRKGNVVAEFTCDRVERHTPHELIVKEDRERATAGSCLSAREIRDYLRGGRTTFNLSELPDFYCWHISDLKVYEKPKPLNWFVMEGDCDCMNCKKCGWFNKGNGYNIEDDCDLGYENIGRETPLKPVFRAPQSWCYVEDLDKDG